MWVKFTQAHDYTPSRNNRVTLHYRPTGGEAGDGVYRVKAECGRAAIKAERAVAVAAPPRRTSVNAPA
ncbi:MAG: hypothetical protein ACT6RD_03360 [Brevundimonas sp.]|uniref:hypothetical protein n=1 Tax=Brevundimonas sp. TaxID=1871086 RepID=UPI0040339024